MKVLLVVDMQNIFVGKNHAEMFTYDNKKLLASVNSIISGYNPENVFYIRNLMKDNLISKLAPVKVFEGTDGAKLADDLKVVSDNVFIKYKGDAFSNPLLTEALRELKADEVEIVGIDGGGCVVMTAIGAVNNGFKSAVNNEAVGTIFVKRANKYKDKMLKAGVKFI